MINVVHMNDSFTELIMDKFVKDLLTEDVLIEVANRYNVNKENLYFVGVLKTLYMVMTATINRISSEYLIAVIAI